MNNQNNQKNTSTSQKESEAIPHQTLEVEIINPDGSREKVGSGRSRQWHTRGNGPVYGTAWNFASIDNTGCLCALFTCFLFLFCLGQYGALAAIGFLVFHTIGSVMGSVHFARKLMRGQPVNIWTWRIGNWLVSFFLVLFLSGQNG